ncbi:GGDEF domain-containing protein [Gracilibacillus sp. S3-1-1]|uniref:GGDEF domain-containing protein n=1 Tax=Gracilibacillus pellucidus TaxID=3095368 RepID=A0ACC6M9H9_9BACI|nr:GGDEF domain-containing protein [Gracilibacillus sp. S3-1-1]MDX8047427.1 GGDEF domain-containing protein [Gracilibacillus sp. S3-1-1]
MRNKKIKMWFFLLFFIFTTLLHIFSIPIVFSITFGFAQILYLVSIRQFGLKFALLLTISVNAFVYIVHIESVLVFINTLAVLFMGFLYEKKGKTLFKWSFVYSFILFFVYYLISFFWVDLTENLRILSSFVLIKVILGTLFSALIADMCFEYLPFFPKLQKWFWNQPRLHFGQVISHLLVFSAVLPLMVIIGLDAKAGEDNIYQGYYTQFQQVEEYLQLKEMELLSHSSEAEKVEASAVLDDTVSSLHQRMVILDEDDQIWFDTDGQVEHKIVPFLVTNQYVKEVNPNNYIFLSSTDDRLASWYRGYYVGETTFLNNRTYVVYPIAEDVMGVMKNIRDYCMFALLMLVLALIFAIIVNRVLSSSLERLTRLTSDLPEKMKRQEGFYWNATPIVEFSMLGKNIEQVARQLQTMFTDAKKKNELLTARTSQLIESESKLYRLAHYDGLTELPNRYSFHTDVRKRLTNADSDEKFVIIFIDLDKFKQVNDTLGHSGGDLLLKVFAKRLIRFEQNKRVTFYRLAGDEFVAVAEERDIQQLCEQLLEMIHQPILINKTKVTLTASIGLSFYPDDGKTLDQLLHQADSLMYEDKKCHHELQQLTTFKDERGRK